MKTKIQTLGAVRRAALIVATLALPALLAAQPGKMIATPSDGRSEVPPPPALKEETFLGVSTHSVDAALAAQMELPPETGLVVVQIMPDSPANAVLKPLDLLTRFDDQILIEPRQLGVLVRSKKEGDEVKLTLFRAGKKQTVSVTLAKKEMPPLPPRFVPGFRKVTTFEGEPIASLRASRPGPLSVGAKTLRPAEMRISKFEGKSSAMFFDDGEGRLEISFKDGKKQLKARDARGDIVFNGPVETPEDRKALPADVRARLEKMEAMDVHIPAPPAGEIHEFRSEPGAFSPGPDEGRERNERELFARPLPAIESDVV